MDGAVPSVQSQKDSAVPPDPADWEVMIEYVTPSHGPRCLPTPREPLVCLEGFKGFCSSHRPQTRRDSAPDSFARRGRDNTRALRLECRMTLSSN